MKFNYADNSGEYKDKFYEFDLFLENLSNQYPEEFEKDIYKERKFLLISSNWNGGAGYNLHYAVPKEIKEAIENKLRELFS